MTCNSAYPKIEVIGMTRTLFVRFFLGSLLAVMLSDAVRAQSSNFIIQKESGRIILAYKAFEEFLRTDKSWGNYRKIVLDAYPEMQAIHDRIAAWGGIDSLKFPEKLKNYKSEDWKKYATLYDEKKVSLLYDSIIEKANTILPPVKNIPVDMCLFLPYGGCFLNPEKDKMTICISLLTNPDDVQKITAHEYAHYLHIQRHDEEPQRLRREVVSEGIAVYLTTLIVKDLPLSKAIPFMPESSVQWCFENERAIKDSIKAELNDSTDRLFKRYISDGSYASPPNGFVQKTGYFAGYRIIEACVERGMPLEEICSLASDAVIARSGYFDK
jgi:hypothetical protein